MSNENTMAVVSPMNESQEIISSIQNAGSEIFHSFDVATKKDQIKLFNATSGDGETVKENINKTLEIVDVVVMPVDVLNEDGTTATVPRTTLITKEGRQISATSWGVFNSMKRINAIFGGLHFDEPLKIVPVEVKTKNGFTINMKLV